MPTRTLRKLHAARRDDIADLVTRRPMPGPTLDQLDPFLFLNHHGPQRYPPHNRGLPFGPHPHRGFETVTFIVAGELMHRDSGGHDSVMRAGGVQWMTAGRGLVHAELSPARFKEQGGPLELLQLWVNLPARLKMTPPAYVGLQREELPVSRLAAAEVQVISGALGAVQGPIASRTDVSLMMAQLAPGAALALPAPRERSVLLYSVRGAVSAGGGEVPQFHLAELNADGDEVALRSEEGALLLFGCAPPLGEPVVSHGPFVMNTRDEIVQAVRDYHAGLFGPEPQAD